MDEGVVEQIDQPGEDEGDPGDDDDGVAHRGGELVSPTINIVHHQSVQLHQIHSGGDAQSKAKIEPVVLHQRKFLVCNEPCYQRHHQKAIKELPCEG